MLLCTRNRSDLSKISSFIRSSCGLSSPYELRLPSMASVLAFRQSSLSLTTSKPCPEMFPQTLFSSQPWEWSAQMKSLTSSMWLLPTLLRETTGPSLSFTQRKSLKRRKKSGAGRAESCYTIKLRTAVGSFVSTSTTRKYWDPEQAQGIIPTQEAGPRHFRSKPTYLQETWAIDGPQQRDTMKVWELSQIEENS